MKADIDIDFRTDFKPQSIFPWIRASIIRNDEFAPHPCGYYPQTMPKDPVTGLAAIPYKNAEELGWAKIDFLHLSIYDYFESREEIEALLEIEPDWGLLQIASCQRQLFQLANHGDVLDAVAPKSIEDLADVLALIRPGKRALLKLYQRQRATARAALYAQDADGYSFKRSHALAYALVIVLQLHLIASGVTFGTSSLNNAPTQRPGIV